MTRGSRQKSIVIEDIAINMGCNLCSGGDNSNLVCNYDDFFSFTNGNSALFLTSSNVQSLNNFPFSNTVISTS